MSLLFLTQPKAPSGETQFDTAPTGAYVVSYGDTTTEVRVSEEAVLNGEEIKV